jgi:hypothetical protein
MGAFRQPASDDQRGAKDTESRGRNEPCERGADELVAVAFASSSSLDMRERSIFDQRCSLRGSTSIRLKFFIGDPSLLQGRRR